MGSFSMPDDEPRSTYGKVAPRTTQLAEIGIPSAHNSLMHLDIGAVAELDSQVRVCALVEPLARIHCG
jgi:hypothetical protein